MNPDNPNSSAPSEASLLAAKKLKRYDIKKLMANPNLRRHLVVRGTIATQAREGIDVSYKAAESSYYVVTEGERAAFFALAPFRSEAGENDGRQMELVRALTDLHSPVRCDVSLRDFISIDTSPLAYDKLALIGPLFRNFPPLEPTFGVARQGKATAGDDRWLRCHWEVFGDHWVPFAKGGSFCRFYADIYLQINWHPECREELKRSGNALPSEELYFHPGLTWPLRTQRGFNVRRMPEGCVFGHKGPAIIPNEGQDHYFLLGILNSRIVEYMLRCFSTFGAWEVGAIKKVPIPTTKVETRISAYSKNLHDAKSNWDTGSETCTRFDRPWVLQPSVNQNAATFSASLDGVLVREQQCDLGLCKDYAELNDAVFRLYSVNDTLRTKIDAVIGERPPEIIWPQMEGKDTAQKRREHVDRLLCYLVKRVVDTENDGIVCLQRVAHRTPLIERVRRELAGCFPSQEPSALEIEVVNELKKKTKGYRRAESLAEWLHDAFFEIHNSLYLQRPVLWHLASNQVRTEPGFACIVDAHRFTGECLAKLRSVYLRERITTLRRESAQAGQDHKEAERIELLALVEEVEEYDIKLKLLQEGAHIGPEAGDRDYRILTPWKSPANRPRGWNPDLDDGIKVNLAPLARTNLLRKRLRLAETKEED
jgi:hypothetical protein